VAPPAVEAATAMASSCWACWSARCVSAAAAASVRCSSAEVRISLVLARSTRRHGRKIVPTPCST